MNILMISGDPRVFDEHSDVRGRMRAYAASVDSLAVVVPARKEVSVVRDGSLTLVPAVGGRFSRFVKAVSVARSLEKPDMITAQNVAEYGLVGWLVSLYFKVPLEVQVHTDMFSGAFARHSLLNRVRLVFAHFLLGRAGMVRVVSGRIKASLLRHVPDLRAPVCVVPVAMVVEEVVYDPARPREVLVVSRLESEKRIDLVLRAIKELIDDGEELRLVLLGDGSLRESLEQLAGLLGIADQVSFKGWVSEVGPYYARASVYLHLSAYEGYSLTLMEAATIGVPIVTTDVGVVGHELSQDGLVVVSGDGDLAMGIKSQLNDPVYPQVVVPVATLEETVARVKDCWQRLIYG